MHVCTHDADARTHARTHAHTHTRAYAHAPTAALTAALTVMPTDCADSYTNCCTGGRHELFAALTGCWTGTLPAVLPVQARDPRPKLAGDSVPQLAHSDGINTQ